MGTPECGNSRPVTRQYIEQASRGRSTTPQPPATTLRCGQPPKECVLDCPLHGYGPLTAASEHHSMPHHSVRHHMRHGADNQPTPVCTGMLTQRVHEARALSMIARSNNRSHGTYRECWVCVAAEGRQAGRWYSRCHASSRGGVHTRACWFTAVHACSCVNAVECSLWCLLVMARAAGPSRLAWVHNRS